MSFIVQAQGISKTFAAPAGGRLHALREVSLQARAGQLTALVGPDGAGKTTLMRLLAALLAQHLPMQDAACAAVWMHGTAAELLAARGIGPIGLTAGEIADAVRELRNLAAG